MASSLLKQAQKKLGSQLQSLASEQAAPKNGLLPLSAIIVKSKQVRGKLEDSEHQLKELALTFKRVGFLQPILVRPVQGGKYELIAGERRYRAATLAGFTEIPVYVKAMTDEQAREAQLIENLHRKNLTQFETAARIQEDLDANDGDIQKVLEIYGKPQSGKAWISKMLSLLKLTPQAQRLVEEDISADTEVILAVKRLEQLDSNKAEEVVEKLKASRAKGKGVARKTVNAAKAELTEGKSTKKNSAELVTTSAAPAGKLKASNQKRAEELNHFYQKGQSASHWYESVSQGIREGHFDSSPEGNLRLLAFSKGYDKDESFSALALLVT